MKNKEIVKKLKDSLDYEFDLSFNDRKELLSHIEQLENLCNKYEQEHKTTFEVWKEDIKKLKQLENNRDKALKFIKENSYKKGDGTIMYDTDIQKLENIIKGDSDD